jgi:hypothetical protein
MPKRNKIKRSRRDQIAIKPPQLQPYPRTTHTLRFVATGAEVRQTISSNFIFNALGCLGVTSTSVQGLWGSLRVKRLRMWSPFLSDANYISVEWGSQGVGSAAAIVVSDNSVSDMAPSFIDTTPPVGALASFWQNAGENQSGLFLLTYPEYCVVDLTVDAVMWNNNGTGSTSTVTSATLGDIYYLALDGPSQNTLVPQGLNTTH